MLVKIANREDPDQTASEIRLLLQEQSDLGLHYLSRIFSKAISVLDFRT